MPVSAALTRAGKALREHALTYPDTTEDFPWGHTAIKVRGKVFVVFATDGGELRVSVKLPGSNMAALMLPFASPTGYGLGRSGWVTAAFAGKDKPPLDLLRSWIDESFRAIAPKALVRQLPGGNEPKPRKPRRR